MCTVHLACDAHLQLSVYSRPPVRHTLLTPSLYGTQCWYRWRISPHIHKSQYTVCISLSDTYCICIRIFTWQVLYEIISRATHVDGPSGGARVCQHDQRGGDAGEAGRSPAAHTYSTIDRALYLCQIHTPRVQYVPICQGATIPHLTRKGLWLQYSTVLYCTVLYAHRMTLLLYCEMRYTRYGIHMPDVTGRGAHQTAACAVRFTPYA